jgi:hypothetical protein
MTGGRRAEVRKAKSAERRTRGTASDSQEKESKDTGAKLWAYIIHKNDRAARLLKEQPQRELRDAKSWIYGIREKTI